MPSLAVQIVRLVDTHQPGFVECTFVDAEGRQHRFSEKMPVVTLDDLSERSQYPHPGVIACEVEASWLEPDGRALVRVTTERPWGVESVEGQTRFVVPLSSLGPERAV